MGLFGDDKRQDERLDALEAHIRILTESAQQTQLDIAEVQITLMETKSLLGQLQDQLGQKLSVDEIDPMISKLNEQLGSARDRYNEVSQAADESWATLQDGAHESYETLRSSVRDATSKMKSVK